MDFTQIILLISVSILTIILALVGFEVFLIFREFLQATKKVNRVLDDVGLVSSSIAKQVVNINDLIVTARTTFDLARGFFRKEKENDKEEKSDQGTSDRHLFTRAGKKLT